MISWRDRISASEKILLSVNSFMFFASRNMGKRVGSCSEVEKPALFSLGDPCVVVAVSVEDYALVLFYGVVNQVVQAHSQSRPRPQARRQSCLSSSATAVLSTVFASEIDAAEPSIRNSNLLPVKAKGEVRFLSVVSFGKLRQDVHADT